MYRTLLALPLGELSAATPTERAFRGYCRLRGRHFVSFVLFVVKNQQKIFLL
ncbi:MAG: hypothetical protein FWH14_07965 [Oscillospiraceae bacterium]|nr:hypothetical protein [Oscillospiraceae bacterium]